MRIGYSQVIGMTVISADGATIGRVRDLLAARRGDSLRVTTLLVGERALMERIGFTMRNHLRTLQPHRVPWSQVERIEGRTLRLRVTEAEMRPRGASTPDEHAPEDGRPRDGGVG